MMVPIRVAPPLTRTQLCSITSKCGGGNIYAILYVLQWKTMPIYRHQGKKSKGLL